jgi:CBS domain containing-hemolysin-like protein
MNQPDVLLVGVAVVLVVVAGVFASADAALSSMSRARAAELVEQGRSGARRVLAVAEDPPRYLNTVLLLQTAAETTAIVLVALVVADTYDPTWQQVVVAVAIMLVVSFVAIGVAPRTLGRQHAERIALLSAGPVTVLTRILGPLPRLLILLGNALTPGKGFREGPFASEAELREMVDLAEQDRLIESGERAMIHSVFELGDTIAREVMVPRTEMVWIEADKSLRQALVLFLRSGFSRIPVIGDSVDDVLGVLYLKDVVRRTQTDPDTDDVPVVDLMRDATFVPESKPVDDLLSEMQAARTHMVIVVDEYGGTAGLVTIEDILEEIVGEITDEYDVERPPVERLPDGSVRVTARLPIEDLGELFDVDLPADEVETVAGLLAHALGRVPIPGAAATVGGLRLLAEGTTGRRNRIDTVLVCRADDTAREADHADVVQDRHERQPADA